MSTTVQTIQTLGDDRRRDSTTGAVSSDKKLRAIQSTLSEIHALSHWEFTRRVATIDLYADETDYGISALLGITDFKDVAELRRQDDHTVRFEYTDTDDFSVYSGKGNINNYFTVEKRKGVDVLRVRFLNQRQPVYLGDTSSYNGNGTWTANTSSSDATGVLTDDDEFRDSAGSVSFDVDVSQSVNNYAEVDVTASTSVDLTDYYGLGKVFGWWYIPTATYVTGATYRVGNDSSNYYTSSITTDSQNGSLTTGWNRVAFPIFSSASTGTVDLSTVDYFLFRHSYSASQSDDNNVRINGFQIKYPERHELVYYSSALVQDSSNVWQTNVSSVSDTILVPDRYREVVVNGYTSNLLMQMGKIQEATIYEQKFQRGLKGMAEEFGVNPKNEVKAFRPRIPYNS